MDARAKRAAALEEKKKRIEEMRKRREQRRVGAPSPAAGAEDAAPAAAGSAAKEEAAELDDYISSLLSQPAAAEAAEAAAEAAPEPEEEATPPRRRRDPKVPLRLCPGDTEVHVLPLREQLITYAKEVQTEEPEAEAMATQTSPEDFPAPGAGDEAAAEEAAGLETGDGAAEPREDAALSPEDVARIAGSAAFNEFVEKAGRLVERELDQTEAFDILVKVDDTALHDASAETQAWISETLAAEGQARGRPVMDLEYHPVEGERLLLVAYGAPDRSKGGRDPAGGAGPGTGTGGDTMPAASAPGLVVLWTMTRGARWALVFPCASPVLCIRWIPGSAHLFAAATYAGLVYIFDTRRRGRHAACSAVITEEDAGGHAHPVFCLAAFAGSRGPACGAAESDAVLLSCDTTGKVCLWQCQSLGKGPRTWLSFRRNDGAARKDEDPAGLAGFVNATSMACTLSRAADKGAGGLRSPAEAILEGETDVEVYLGTEAGELFRARVAVGGSSGGRSGVEDTIGEPDAGEGEGRAHAGLITAIHLHPSRHPRARGPGHGTHMRLPSMESVDASEIVLSDLVLTASLDWTCKLWSPGSALEDGVGHAVPLLELRSAAYEYMVDARWSPDHPALFATANSVGQVDVWHLTRSMEEPVASVSAEPAGPETSAAAVSKLVWAPGSRRLAVGTLDGRVLLVQLDEDLGHPGVDEARKLQHGLETRLERLVRLPDAADGAGP